MWAPDRVKVPLPCTCSSPAGSAFSSPMAATRSPERTVVFAQRASWSVVDATYLGLVFKGSPDRPSRPNGRRRARRCAGRTGTRPGAGTPGRRTSWPRCRTAARPIHRARIRRCRSRPAPFSWTTPSTETSVVVVGFMDSSSLSREAHPEPWGRTRAAAAVRRTCGFRPCRGRRLGTRRRSGPCRCVR